MQGWGSFCSPRAVFPDEKHMLVVGGARGESGQGQFPFAHYGFFAHSILQPGHAKNLIRVQGLSPARHKRSRRVQSRVSKGCGLGKVTRATKRGLQALEFPHVTMADREVPDPHRARRGQRLGTQWILCSQKVTQRGLSLRSCKKLSSGPAFPL